MVRGTLAELVCGSEPEEFEIKGMHLNLSQDDIKVTLDEVHRMCEPPHQKLRHAMA